MLQQGGAMLLTMVQGQVVRLSLCITYLFIVHVRLKPVPQAARGEGVAQEHEPNSADVGGITVVNQPHHLLDRKISISPTF